jgi:glucosamine--fructose-6-phosphate aminotransferase (isomerizing)
MVGEYYIRQLLGTVNVESVLSSELELKYADINFPQKTILIALTQSGETKDTNDAIEFAKQKGITVVSLVNKPYSEAEKISDFVIRLLANWETSVVATKTFVAELLVLLLLSISLSEDKKRYEILDEVKKLPDTLNTVFKKK